MAPADEVLPEDVLSRLEALSDKLNDVSKQLQKVADASRNTRRLAIGLAVSLVLDVLLTITVTLLSLSALSQSAAQHQSQLASCAISNDSRTQQRALWGYLFNLAGGAKTSEQKQFLGYVNKTFSPINCAKLYP